jgi:hypothetical protein
MQKTYLILALIALFIILTNCNPKPYYTQLDKESDNTTQEAPENNATEEVLIKNVCQANSY